MHAVPHKQRRSFRARNLSPRWMASHLQQWDEGANAIVAPCSNIPGPDGCLSDPKASRTIQMRWSRKPNNCSKVSLLKASRMTVSNRRQVPQKAYPLLTANGPFAVSLLLSENCINADIGPVGRSISDRWLDPLKAVALRLLLNVRQTLYREPPSSERFRCTAANQFVGISYAERLGILRCFELVPSDRYGDWCSAIRK